MENLNEKVLLKVQNKIGYCFSNIDLLKQAFMSKNYAREANLQDNQMLEFIGDSFLGSTVTKLLLDDLGFINSNYSSLDEDSFDQLKIKNRLNEEDFSKIRSQLVSNDFLAKRFDDLELLNCALISEGDLKNDFLKQIKPKADFIEAIIGAVAVDSRYDQMSIEECVCKTLDFKANYHKIMNGYSVIDKEEAFKSFTLDNCVTKLKEMADKCYCSVAEYIEDAFPTETGPVKWRVIAKVDSWNLIYVAVKNTKGEAKKYATYGVLCAHFNKRNEYEDTSIDNDIFEKSPFALFNIHEKNEKITITKDELDEKINYLNMEVDELNGFLNDDNFSEEARELLERRLKAYEDFLEGLKRVKKSMK